MRLSSLVLVNLCRVVVIFLGVLLYLLKVLGSLVLGCVLIR